MAATNIPGRGVETRELIRVAWPLVVSYLINVAGVIITKIVVGRFGFKELAAVGLSTDVTFTISIIVLSLFSVVGVLVAEARGAAKPERIVVALIQGLILATIVGLGVSVLVYHLDRVLLVLGQSAETAAIAKPYCQAYAYSVLPFVLFGVLQSFVAAMGRTGVVLVATVLSVIAQYFLMYGLAHGAYGLPAFGVAGAGAGWSIANVVRLIVIAVFVVWLIKREALPFLHGSAWAALRKVGHFFWLGVPIAVITGLETCLFSAASLMSGWLGQIELAAYQMVMGWIAIPFVISLAFADAAMVRVSYWSGAQSPSAARQAGLLGMILGIGLPLLLVIIPLTAPGLIARLFLSTSDPGFAQVASLVASLLVIAALFQIFDGLQAIASHALRGVKDSQVPMLICAFGYWAIGAPAGYLLAFNLGWRAHGLWWGVALGVGVTAVLLTLRFARLTKGD
jgi:multidrug resistance protein, MATE family